MHSFDDDDETDMNSSCAAVSQILLSLENVLPQSPYNKLSSLPHTLTHCEDISRNYESQSTVDETGLTQDDDRHISDRSMAADDHDRQVSDDDETQYIERCPTSERGLVPLFGLDHTYHTEDSIALSADNSPRLLDATKPFQFILSDDVVHMNSTATEMNAAPVVTATDIQMFDVDIEPQGQVRADISQNSLTLSVDNSPSLLDTTKLLQFMPSNDIVPISSTTTEMYVAPIVTAADIQMLDVNVEPQRQMRPDIDQSDTCSVVSVPPTVVINAAPVVTAADTQMFDVDIEPQGQVRADISQNSIALLADTSPSLLDTTKSFQFMSSNDIVPMNSTTAEMNVAPVATAADTEIIAVDVEQQGQVRANIGQSDSCSTVSVLVPAVSNIIKSSLASDSLHQVELCSCDATNDVTVHCSAASSRSATRLDCVEISDDDCLSPLALSSLNLQVQAFTDFFCPMTYMTTCL